MEVSEETREFLRTIGRKGGKVGGVARAENLSAARRKAIAEKASKAAAKARSAKARAKKKAKDADK